MAPICQVCKHPRRKEIDAKLLDPNASLRDVMREFGIATTSLHRHRVSHQGWVPVKDMKARTEKENKKRAEMAAPSRVAYLESKLPTRDECGEVLSQCVDRLDKIVKRAEKSGADAVAISGLDGIRKQIADLSRLAGHIGGAPMVNVGVAVNVSAADVASELARYLGAAAAPDIREAISADYTCEAVDE